MKNKYILVLIGLAFIAYFTFIIFNIKSRRQDLAIFLSAKLEGKVVYLYSSSGGERFSLDNSPRKFIFWAHTGVLNDYHSFDKTAEIGDSIVKPAYSDTLLLIKKSGKRYEYTFKTSYNIIFK